MNRPTATARVRRALIACDLAVVLAAVSVAAAGHPTPAIVCLAIALVLTVAAVIVSLRLE